MTVVLDAQAALPETAWRAAMRDQRTAGIDALEEIIASHRIALLDLAPRQEERAARVEACWHIDELGMLLQVRDGGQDRVTQNAAPSAMQGRERQWEDTSTDRLTH